MKEKNEILGQKTNRHDVCDTNIHATINTIRKHEFYITFMIYMRSFHSIHHNTYVTNGIDLMAYICIVCECVYEPANYFSSTSHAFFVWSYFNEKFNTNIHNWFYLKYKRTPINCQTTSTTTDNETNYNKKKYRI